MDQEQTSTIGAGVGAGIGSIWGPAGAAVGMGLGGMAGGLFGKKKQIGFSKGDLEAMYASRNNQISDFSNQLASMRSQYMAQIPQLNAAAFKQFMPDAEAQYASRGLGVNSGAFASSLARFALPMQANMYNNAFSSGVNNANMVNNAYGQSFGTMMGAAGANTSPPQGNPAGAAFGNMAGNAMMMYAARGGAGNPSSPMTTSGVPGWGRGVGDGVSSWGPGVGNGYQNYLPQNIPIG